MSVYSILTKNKFTKTQKQKVAKKITDVHCNITGEPSRHVTITFLSGYCLKHHNKIMVLGNIRIGSTKTAEVIEKLKFTLNSSIASTLKVEQPKINIDFLIFKPSWVLEGNTIS